MVKKGIYALAGYVSLVIGFGAHAEPVYGTILLRKPVVTTIRLVGTLSGAGDVELHGANGVQARGVIKVNGDAFQAAMFNIAPQGSVFFDGSTSAPFNVKGSIKDGVMAGDFNESDEGRFILCNQATYARQPKLCDGS